MTLNRYAKKLRHKYALKKDHAVRFGRYSVKYDEQHERYWNDQFSGTKWYDDRNDGYQYWQRFYLSGSRKYAKDCTNSVIRSKYRALISNGELDEIIAPRGSDYEKEFDYLWTIY